MITCLDAAERYEAMVCEAGRGTHKALKIRRHEVANVFQSAKGGVSITAEAMREWRNVTAKRSMLNGSDKRSKGRRH
jgi:hypothetical protein